MATWIAVGAFMFLQSFSNTFISRARNSASLGRHVVASMFSSGIWIVSLSMILSTLMTAVQGQYGLLVQLLSVGYYVIMTVSGSVASHWWALRNERGASAVGASRRYAQITQEEWDAVKANCRDRLPETETR